MHIRKSAAIRRSHPPPPSIPLSSLHLAHPSFYPFVLYVFYNRCNNRLIWKTLNYRAPSHLPTLRTQTHGQASAHTHTQTQIKKKKKKLFYKGAVKTGKPHVFPIRLLFEGTGDCFETCVFVRRTKSVSMFPVKVFEIIHAFSVCADLQIGLGRQMRDGRNKEGNVEKKVT